MKQTNIIFLLSILMLFFNGQLWAQFSQIGIDIDGEAAGDKSGQSVCLSENGNILAIGGLYNAANGHWAGHVRVYEWNGTAWQQRGNDLDGEAANDQSGYSVSLSANGNILAIGARGNSGNGNAAGHVRIYEWNGSNWVQRGNDIDGEAADNQSGTSVSLSSNGNTLAIGAPFNDDNGAWAGHARIYEWSGIAWVQRGSDIDGEAAGDEFGSSVSLSSNGNIIAIGGAQNDGNGTNAGHVRVYEWNGTAWQQRGIDIDGGAANDESGYSVSLSANGNILAIGVIGNNYGTGQARVYEWNGTVWIQRGSNLDGEAYGDTYGISVSLSDNGNIIAIGGLNNDGSASNAGHVRIYEWNGTDWVQKGDDIDGESSFDLSGVAVSLSASGNIVGIGAPRSSGNTNISDYGHVRVYDLKGIYGYTYQDFNQNCIQDLLDVGLANRTLILNPGNRLLQTNSSGFWYIDSLPVGTYTLTADTSSYNWQLQCASIQSFTITNPDSSIIAPSFGYHSNYSCTAPDISIYAPFLRPGFSNQKVYVEACNSQTASDILYNAYVIVNLDTLLAINTGSMSYTNLGNNQYQVNVGDLYPGQCVDFSFSTTLSINAVLGETLCMNANLYPVDSCALDSIPNPYPSTSLGSVSPCTLPWDKSSLRVEGTCLNDSVRFVVYNTGFPGGGDMDCFAPVRAYLDGTWILLDSLQLQGGDSIVFMFAGDGRTWRLEADQHPLHPGNSHPNASVELCGNAVNWTSNLVNALPHDDADPTVDIYCGLVTGSYDPNDKTGYPLGLGSNHEIEPNQDMEYIIRFQNTGTDTAFTVVIRDTLSTDLDIFSLRSGTSSHDYTFRMYGPRVLEWTFNNIMLPDSNINLIGSNGFVSFKVHQVPNLAIGTVIENSASIYFDFNAPIFTNTSWHTIALPQDLSWDGQQALSLTACSTYTFNNVVYDNAGTYWQVVNNAGLDSLYTLNVGMLNNDSTLSETGCNSYTAPDGQAYTTSGQYTAIIPNTAGCDSTITINLTIKDSTSISINETVCNSYTAPDGQIYTVSGQYTAIIPNVAGCDSIITINLIIKDSTSVTISEAICNSYTAPDGQAYTISGQYTAIIPNAIGCDSIITINLTIKENSSVTIKEDVCNTYTAPDGQVYTTSGQYTAVIPNAAGCDSTITIVLTIKDNTSVTISEAVCNTYTAPDGQVYTTSGQYTAVIPNAAGCDSTITIVLTIKDNTAVTISEVVCNSYAAPDGQIYTTSGQYMAIMPNAVGCDSIITINLTIDNLPSDSITQNGTTLTTYVTGLTYQWLDCNNGNAILVGETNESFTPLFSGNYAVEIVDGTCSTVSACVNVTGVSLANLTDNLGVLVYPNPTTGILYLEKENNQEINIEIWDNLGRILLTQTSSDFIANINLGHLPTGVYYIAIGDGDRVFRKKIVKQ
jgi:uncharacterized repeat protein (TIGR01451 family)